MRLVAPTLILTLALVLAGFSLFGSDGYARLRSLRGTLAEQKSKNEQLEQKVAGLKRRVAGIQSDARELEKAARNELGMARDNETVFIFQDLEER